MTPTVMNVRNTLSNFGPTGQLVWKEVQGFDGRYEVSSDGQVRSWARKGPNDFRNSAPNYLSHDINHSGYHQVTLFSKGGKRHRLSVHRLVLQEFVCPCPDGMEASHINGKPGDNRVENLEWKTHFDNIQDKITHGTMNYGIRRDRRKKVAV